MTTPAAAVSGDDAVAIARESYGLDVRATPLPGERDLNFRLDDDAGGARFVLKLHHAGRRRGRARSPGSGAPPHRGTAARAAGARGSCGEPSLHGGRIVRLLTWLDGTPWQHAGPHDAKRMADLGRHVARLDVALRDFEHPAMRRDLLWNLTAAPTVSQWVELVDPDRRAPLEAIFERYRALVEPRLGELPHQVIHNDANEHNVLVDDGGGIAGLIDFGDVVWSPRVCGLAVAGAYAMAGQPDPLRAVAPLVYGYDQVTPLAPLELELLFDLMRTRLAMSVCMSAYRRAGDPGNDYLLISQDAVGDLLDRLAEASPQLAHFRFRDACGYEANPDARRVRQHFESGAVATALGARGRRRHRRRGHPRHQGRRRRAGGAVHRPLRRGPRRLHRAAVRGRRRAPAHAAPGRRPVRRGRHADPRAARRGRARGGEQHRPARLRRRRDPRSTRPPTGCRSGRCTGTSTRTRSPRRASRSRPATASACSATRPSTAAGRRTCTSSC